MAKHVGSRGRPRRLAAVRRLRLPGGGLGWWLGALVVVVFATVIAVPRTMASHDPVDAAIASSHIDRSPRASDALPPSVGETTRAADVSRQAVRPERDPYRVRAGTTLVLTRAAALARKVAALSPTSSTFTIAQSNILGSQHTLGRGGFGSGPARAAITASLLTSRGADAGGMEEVQANQLYVLQNRMPAYSFWPAASLGHNGIRNQIYWRSDQFTMQDHGWVTYVFSSQHIPLPYVLLRDRATGAEFWMIATHNSAGGMQGQRDAATGVEIALISRLMATDRPVFIVGDMNEHTEFFCRVATSTGMVAGNGGSGAGGCRLPPPPLRVDWIMGGHGVSFSGYHQDGAGLGRASDHYYLYATATATSRWYAP